MDQKWLQKVSRESTKIDTFRDLFRTSILGCILVALWFTLGTLWAPIGSLLASFGSFWHPFGPLWLPFGTLWLPFGSLLVPFPNFLSFSDNFHEKLNKNLAHPLFLNLVCVTMLRLCWTLFLQPNMHNIWRRRSSTNAPAFLCGVSG